MVGEGFIDDGDEGGVEDTADTGRHDDGVEGTFLELGEWFKDGDRFCWADRSNKEYGGEYGTDDTEYVGRFMVGSVESST